MRARALRWAGLLLAGAALGGCGQARSDGELRSPNSPDEFMILPTKPLEMPQNMAALPTPTPGARNRVDYDPRAQAVASLTGREAAAGTASAGSVIARAGPVDPNIRAQLAAEDATWREENRGKLLPRLFARDPDDVTYGAVTLDAAAEYEAMRARGIAVPPAPPMLLEEE